MSTSQIDKQQVSHENFKLKIGITLISQTSTVPHETTVQISDNRALFVCKKCNFESTDTEAIPLHLARHNEEERKVTFGCEECDYQTKDKDVLDTHLDVHYPFACQQWILHQSTDPDKIHHKICTSRFRDENGLNNHRLTHRASGHTSSQFDNRVVPLEMKDVCKGITAILLPVSLYVLSSTTTIFYFVATGRRTRIGM